MTQVVRNTIAILGIAGLSACASIPAPSPVEVTRFHDPAAIAAAQTGTVFVASAPGSEDSDSLELAPYKAAVAKELTRLGFTEASADGATYVAQVSADSFRIASGGGRRGPVSVGGGASTGSYGSGVGLGIGINLGGGSRERIGNELRVMIRNAGTDQTIWEGRAEFTASPKSEYASPASSAAVLAQALFSEYPGNNGETVKVKAPE